jgi:hypothetical protein
MKAGDIKTWSDFMPTDSLSFSVLPPFFLNIIPHHFLSCLVNLSSPLKPLSFLLFDSLHRNLVNATTNQNSVKCPVDK